MPVALSSIIATVVGTGAVGAALQTGLAAITMFASTTLGGLALSLGLSYLASSLFRPSQPKPEDVQQQVRQPTAPRVRHYGRVKTSGTWAFAEAKSGTFHKVLALGQGPFDAIEEIWIDDKKVDLDPSGWVITAPWNDPDTDNAKIEYRLGENTETAYASLMETFPEWTDQHRGDGVASLYAYQAESSQSNYLTRWPNGINTNYRVVARTSRVKNPVTGAIEWNDRAAAVIRDYMTHADGMRLPENLFTTPLAHAG